MPNLFILAEAPASSGIIGWSNRGAQAGRAGGLLGGSFRKAAFAGIAAMLVKRMLRRKSY